MKRSYQNRDYDFGQVMLNLRAAIGLTQSGLADYLGISRFAVGDWEAGNKYPKAEHLKSLIELAVQHQAFPVGQEADAIRALWKAARTKILLDEIWLAALLRTGFDREKSVTAAFSTRVDWGDALAIPHFYGREWELNLLMTWLVEKRCRVVSTLGLGGIGKSALAVKAMRQVAEHFDVVIWRSVRDAPSCEALVDNLLQVLDPSMTAGITTSLEPLLGLLLSILRSHRVLLVLDNFESVLEEKETTGQMRSGYAGYGQLLRQLAETEHQSCLLLTSREKPGDLVPFEGRESPVRTLRLTHLDTNACQQLLNEKGVVGAVDERAQLIARYAGNPLALKIVAQTIMDIFDGEVVPFLEQGEMIFGGVRELLNRQFSRLSLLEQRVLIWLAILREPTTLTELASLMITPVRRILLLEAVDALYRRSLVEPGQHPGSFTLQSVVLEYTTAHLISHICAEVDQRNLSYLTDYGLELAQVHDYIRQIQQRLILSPVLAHLRQQSGVEKRLLSFLDDLRTRPDEEQGYAPANIVGLLRDLRGHLRSVDLSQLVLRGAYLQAVEMQDTRLSHARIADTVFTDSFSTISSLGISGKGEYWATGSWVGEIRIYQAGGHILYRLWRTMVVTRVALSSDGRLLAGGSAGSEIRVWDVATGALMWLSEGVQQLGHSTELAFSPDGRILAAASDTGLWLWDSSDGTLLDTLLHPQAVECLAWCSDGTLLASGDMTGKMSYWRIEGNGSAALLMSVEGHTGPITGVAFSPSGDQLVSGSWDGTLKIWDVAGGSLIETVANHSDWVQRVAWSDDGRLIGYTVRNEVSWLWDVEQHRHRSALRGHTAFVRGLVFTSDSKEVVSASEDGTIRVWDTATGASIRVVFGYAARVHDLSWSPDGTHLVSVEADTSLVVYALDSMMPVMMLHGHTTLPFGVRWSPNGRFIASNSLGNAIRLWDRTSGELLESLSYPGDPNNTFHGLAWSPDGRCLASGTTMHGIQLFDLPTRSIRPLEADRTLISGYAMRWSPNGAMLAASCEDDTIRVWDVASGTELLRVPGERWCVGWSADNSRLAIFETRSEGSELVLWDVANKERRPFALHPASVIEVAWMDNDHFLLTACNDGWLRWWNVYTGDCVRKAQAHPDKINVMKLNPDETVLASSGEDGAILIYDTRTGELLKSLRRDRPYERMDISGIKGLTDAQKGTLKALGAVEVSGS